MALDTIKRSSLSLSRSLDDVLKHRERERERGKRSWKECAWSVWNVIHSMYQLIYYLDYKMAKHSIWYNLNAILIKIPLICRSQMVCNILY